MIGLVVQGSSTAPLLGEDFEALADFSLEELLDQLAEQPRIAFWTSELRGFLRQEVPMTGKRAPHGDIWFHDTLDFLRLGQSDGEAVTMNQTAAKGTSQLGRQ